MRKDFDILEGHGSGGDVLFATGINMAASMPERPKARNPHADEIYGKLTPWGEDNEHPQNVIRDIEANDTLPAVLEFKVKALTSGGMQYGEIRYDEAAKQDVFVPMYIPEVDDFLSEIEIDQYLDEAALDYYTHANHFVGLGRSAGGKITDLFTVDAAHCRLSKEDTGGKYQEVYVHGDWTQISGLEEAERYKALDPSNRVVQQIKDLKGAKTVMLPVRRQIRGRTAYARGPVDFLRASGWLDIAKEIPKWKRAIMEKQLSIKYHLEVEPRYWKERFPDWDSWSDKDRSAKKQETYREFIKFFSGAEKAGNVLITNYHVDHGGKEWAEWKVTLVKGEAWGDGAYMEESVGSDAHIIRALGVDHTLINLTPGTGYTSGSGSDKRVAFNQHVLLTQPEQRRILRPLDYIAEINGWHNHVSGDSKLRFWFKNTFIATLDHGKDTKPANDQNTKKT